MAYTWTPQTRAQPAGPARPYTLWVLNDNTVTAEMPNPRNVKRVLWGDAGPQPIPNSIGALLLASAYAAGVSGSPTPENPPHPGGAAS